MSVFSICWMSLWRALTAPRTLWAWPVRLDLSYNIVRPGLTEKLQLRIMTYCCLEDTFIAPVGIRRFLYLLLRGFGVYNAILPRDLVTVAYAVRLLLTPELFQLILEILLQSSDLRVLCRIAATALSIRFQEFDLILYLIIQNLCLRDKALKLGRGRAARI